MTLLLGTERQYMHMAIIQEEEFRSWEASVPEMLRGDPVWRFNAYRVSLFMMDRAGRDVKIIQSRRALPFQTDQLLRAVASVCANIAEGLGRASAAERSRFFGIALGSLREAATWYQSVADHLAADLVMRRLEQLTELRKLLIGAQKWLATQPPRTQLM